MKQGIGGLSVKIDKLGDWKKALKLVMDMDALIKEGYHNGASKSVNKFLDELKKNIRNGASKFRYKPLSTDYFSYKLSKGKVALHFNFYGAYRKSLIKRRVGYSYVVTFMPGARNAKTGGQSVKTIATILENGSRKRKIPKRPLWRDTYKSIGGDLLVAKNITSAIRYQFRKKHGIRLK